MSRLVLENSIKESIGLLEPHILDTFLSNVVDQKSRRSPSQDSHPPVLRLTAQ